MLSRYEITHPTQPLVAHVIAWSIDDALGRARWENPAFDAVGAAAVSRWGFALTESEPKCNVVSTSLDWACG